MIHFASRRMSHTSPPSKSPCPSQQNCHLPPPPAGAALYSEVVAVAGSSDETVLNPTAFSARPTSGADMNVFQTNPLRQFSAINTVGPTSIPMTSGLYQLFAGLKASTKPYFR